MMQIRYSTFAGLWYPGDQRRLRLLLQKAFEFSQRRIGAVADGSELAFIVPHAGLEYSATVAAAAYRRIERIRPRRVVILGFSHFRPGHSISIPETEAYRTPLGDVGVESEARSQLLRCGVFEKGDPGDHSVEIQLPFVQFAAEGAVVVPLYVGMLDEDQMADAAAELGSLIDGGTVFVASSDFTHFGEEFGYCPFPVDEHTAERIRALDRKIIDAIGTLDSQEFFRVLREIESTMCGFLPVYLLIELLRTNVPNCRSAPLDYQTSADISGAHETSVSYAALAFSQN